MLEDSVKNIQIKHRLGVPITTVLALAFAFASASLNAASIHDVAGDKSPRLTALTDRAANPKAEAEFWDEIGMHAPLVETIAEDRNLRRVTLLWRGSNDTTRVAVLGGLPGANLIKPMMRLGVTDVWYLTEIHSSKARFQYAFQVNGPEIMPMEYAPMMKAFAENPPRRDPANARVYGGWSYVELPDAPPQPWITKQANVPEGRRREEKFKSRTLNDEYPLSIYTPAGYEKEHRKCWLMIAFDGGFQMMDVTLDNLLAAGKIPPIVVVGVRNIKSLPRKQALDCSDEFAKFLADELVPWARKTYGVYDDSSHTIIGGSSLGGKMATYCGLKYSGIFGKVLSQSGSFLTAAKQESPTAVWNGEPPGMLTALFLENPRLPLEFYIEVGRYETTLAFSPLLETRRLRDVLRGKGYRVTYSEYDGGHNEVCWRGSFADAVMALASER